MDMQTLAAIMFVVIGCTVAATLLFISSIGLWMKPEAAESAAGRMYRREAEQTAGQRALQSSTAAGYNARQITTTTCKESFMSKPNILVTAGALPQYLFTELEKRGNMRRLSELSPEEARAFGATCEIAVTAGAFKFPKEYFELCPNLKMLADFGVGYDGIDLPESIARKVVVSHTPDVLNDEVADHAFMLMQAVTRRLIDQHKYIEAGKWEQAPYPLTTSLGNLNIGIAGLGRIGKEFAARAAAFKTNIGYFGRHKQDVPYTYFDSLKALAEWCDVLMLAMPSNASTKYIVNQEILEAVGPRGFVINIGRGALIDTQALIKALDEGKLGGAGLDVFEAEPHVPAELMHRPNVVLTPHTGSATVRTNVAISDLVLANIDAYLQGKPLVTPVPGSYRP